MTQAAIAPKPAAPWASLPACKCEPGAADPDFASLHATAADRDAVFTAACNTCDGLIALVPCIHCSSLVPLPESADVATLTCDDCDSADPLGHELVECVPCEGEGKVDAGGVYRTCYRCDGTKRMTASGWEELYVAVRALETVGHPLAGAVLGYGLVE